MSNEVNTTPVSAGEPEWTGSITKRWLEQIIAGLLDPNQAFCKALARKVLELEAERDARVADLNAANSAGLAALQRMDHYAAENAQLRADLARMQGPVTDQEWCSQAVRSDLPTFRDVLDAVLTQRAAGKGNE